MEPMSNEHLKVTVSDSDGTAIAEGELRITSGDPLVRGWRGTLPSFHPEGWARDAVPVDEHPTGLIRIKGEDLHGYFAEVVFTARNEVEGLTAFVAPG
jgi:hypothetical protein